MPLGIRRRCSICSSTSTQIWSKNDQDDIICHTCSISSSKPTEENTGKNSENEEKSKSCAIDTDSTANVKASTESCSVDTAPDSSSVKKENGSSVKKSMKTRQLKPRQMNQYKSVSTKGKGRRNIFKKSATKAPSAVATPVTSNSIFHNGYYYQVGDIVSMIDVEGGNYYAQIKGLMQDQYCEKSAAITWLLPTLSSPKDHFDPSTYIIGPEEDLPRKLDCMDFVCHSPSDYFKNQSSPYSTISTKQDTNFIWTRFGPQVKSFIGDNFDS